MTKPRFLLRRLFWSQLNQPRSNIQGRIPFLGLVVNLIPNLKNGRMSAMFCRDVLQLLVGLQVIAQFQPTLSRLQVALILKFKRFDRL